MKNMRESQERMRIVHLQVPPKKDPPKKIAKFKSKLKQKDEMEKIMLAATQKSRRKVMNMSFDSVRE